MSTVCRLLLCEPADGAKNMAIDEALLYSAAESRVPVLRFYRWREPTLSLGYFQKVASRACHPPSQGCVFVRRASGGGAIVHDDELTYGLALPGNHPMAADPLTLYRDVHLALIEALAPPRGHTLVLGEARISTGPEAFLCFQRRAAGDVLFDAAKVAGSAQRRSGGAVLQHGSVLLGRSAFAPELPGWRELTGQCLVADNLVGRWVATLAERLGVRCRHDAMTPTESALADRLVNTKYGTREWTARR
jgi:lipoyl(octanoyl) transferase